MTNYIGIYLMKFTNKTGKNKVNAIILNKTLTNQPIKIILL